MKLITWNINGFRSLMSRTFLDTLSRLDAEIYCFQETKLQQGQGELDMPGYTGLWNYAERRGYSGTAICSLRVPTDCRFGLGEDQVDPEGRVITADLGDFILINVYAPNAAPDLSRLDLRIAWNKALLAHLIELDQRKPVILCGDLNVAYNANDLVSDAQGMQTPGFTREERGSMAAILRSGFVDAYRHFHPKEAAGASLYRKGLRAVGMDYFIVSERLLPRVLDVRALARVRGSDHYPMELTLAE